MWQLVVCVLSRPIIHGISQQTALLTIATWLGNATFREHPMYDEVRRVERRLASRERDAGFVSLADSHGRVRAIGSFTADDASRRVLVSEVACVDYESGSALVRTITRTPGVGCAADLPDRWRIAHAFYTSPDTP